MVGAAELSSLTPGFCAQRIVLPAGLAYWTVCDGGYRPVAIADLYLRGLRLSGRGLAEGTTRVYAGNLACFLEWCLASGRSLVQAAERLDLFVLHLRTTPVARPGSGHGRTRSPERINHILGAVREMYKEAVARRLLPGSVLAALYAVGDDRHLPAELRPEGAGLRYVARPRHRLRAPRRAGPPGLTAGEWEALLRACRSWRDRLLVVLLYYCGLRRGEALGLRRSDLHLAPSSAALGCRVEGPHLHVIPRENVNGAAAKSGRARMVPTHPHVIAAYDRYLEEREACAAAAECDFLFVNLFRPPLGAPMALGRANKLLAALSRRAGLERSVRPHLLRHSMATDLRAADVALEVVQELIGHASILSTQIYLHPSPARLREAVERAGAFRERVRQAIEREDGDGAF